MPPCPPVDDVPSGHGHVVDAPAPPSSALAPLSDSVAWLVFGGVASAPLVALCATNVTPVNVALVVPVTTAPKLELPGAPPSRLAASSSTSWKTTGLVSPFICNAGPAPGDTTIAFVPVYVHGDGAVGQATPPNTCSPTSSPGADRDSDSVYVAPHAITRLVPPDSASCTPLPIVATGASFVPALLSLPAGAGATNTARVSLITHDDSDGVCVGSHEPPSVPPSGTVPSADASACDPEQFSV
jgi:hypothetical protein